MTTTTNVSVSDSPSAIEAATPANTQVVVRPQPILAILSLVFGITGIVTTMIFPFSIAGLVLGILALRREPQARTMAIWGTVISGIPGALIVLVGVFAVLFLIPLAFLAAIA